MLGGIKTLLNAVAEFEDKVEIGTDLEGPTIENYTPANMPSVLLYDGVTEYYEPEVETRNPYRQELSEGVVALLFCRTSERRALENKLVSAVIGYIENENFDFGLVADKSSTRRIDGVWCIRQIVFAQRTRIVHQ